MEVVIAAPRQRVRRRVMAEVVIARLAVAGIAAPPAAAEDIHRVAVVGIPAGVAAVGTLLVGTTKTGSRDVASNVSTNGLL